MEHKSDKIIIGGEEWCAFPGLGIPAIKARVDTGAKTSSIHAFNIQPFIHAGEEWVSFEVHPLQKNRHTAICCEQPVYDKRVVKSSSGVPESRYVVLTSLQIGSDTHAIELTLANRDSMGYRMLLGREALNQRMIVDTSLSFMLGDVPDSTLNEYYVKPETTRTGLRIGLLASNQELYSNQRILLAGTERGHTMDFIDISQCYMKLDSEEPITHYRGGKELADLDAVITRIRPDMTTYGGALIRQFESMGVMTLNNASSIVQSRDKLYQTQLLVKSGISIPASGFAKSPLDTKDLVAMIGGAPLVVKLLEGSRRKDVVLAETGEEAESIIRTFKSQHPNFLVQEYIKEAHGRDLRCFVIGNRVVAAIQREATPGGFRANKPQGGKVSKVKLSPAERSMAVKAAKILGLGIAGVDIVRSNSGPLLLDVNSSPGLKSIEHVTRKDIAGKIIASVEKKLGWSQVVETGNG